MQRPQRADRLRTVPVLLVTIVVLTGCLAPAQVGIAGIVDRPTGQPVGGPTTVTMTVLNLDGKELRTTQCQDCWETLLVSIDSNGREKVFVQVEAPGYAPWETTVDPLSGSVGGMLTVELVPLTEVEAFRARLAESTAQLEHLLVVARRDNYPEETAEVPLSQALDWLRETDRRLGELVE